MEETVMERALLDLDTEAHGVLAMLRVIVAAMEGQAQDPDTPVLQAVELQLQEATQRLEKALEKDLEALEDRGGHHA